MDFSSGFIVTFLLLLFFIGTFQADWVPACGIVNKRSLPPTQPQCDPSMAWWYTKDALEGNHIILQWHRIHLVNPVSTVQLPSVDDHMSKHAKAYIIRNSLLHWTVSQDLWVTQVKEKTVYCAIMANLLLHYLHTYSMFIQGLSILCMAFHFTEPNHSIWSLDQLPSILQVHKLNPQSCTFGKTKKKAFSPSQQVIKLSYSEDVPTVILLKSFKSCSACWFCLYRPLKPNKTNTGFL